MHWSELNLIHGNTHNRIALSLEFITDSEHELTFPFDHLSKVVHELTWYKKKLVLLKLVW
jgi:hypothetical protein